MKRRLPLDPLIPVAHSQALDWEDVLPVESHGVRDALGLNRADREALGLTPPRIVDLAPETEGDATTALAEALARGGTHRRR